MAWIPPVGVTFCSGTCRGFFFFFSFISQWWIAGGEKRQGKGLLKRKEKKIWNIESAEELVENNKYTWLIPLTPHQLTDWLKAFNKWSSESQFDSNSANGETRVKSLLSSKCLKSRPWNDVWVNWPKRNKSIVACFAKRLYLILYITECVHN